MIVRGARYPNLQAGKVYVFEPDVVADAVSQSLAKNPVKWARETFERGKFLSRDQNGYHFEGYPLGDQLQLYHFLVWHFEKIVVKFATETC